MKSSVLAEFDAIAPSGAVSFQGGSARTDSVHGREIDEAYQEYCRRAGAGEALDAKSFCAQLPESIGASLWPILMAHEFLAGAPELMEDGLPGSWPEVGAVWEGFRLLEELGRGAFARVYLARELALGERLVAVKCTTLGPDEAAMLGRLDHPHVVPIHSIRAVPGTRFTLVCMPYLGRATLSHVCGRPSLLDACRDPRLPAMTPPPVLRRGNSLDGVRWIASRIASALTYLHRQGICHRDLKPSNILLQPDGAPRLLDFNLSVQARGTQRLLGGTLHYMAPEQLAAMETKDDRALTPQIDVFALGVILYEWLTGVHPYAPLPEDHAPETLRQHLLTRQQAGLPPLSTLVKLDRALARLVERCLAFRPEERPSAGEVEQELRRQLAVPRRWLRALARAPRRTAAAALLLSTALAVGGYQAAVQPPRAELEHHRGLAAFQAGDFRQAIQHFNQVLQQDSPTAEQYFARAQAYQRLGDRNREFLARAFEDYEHAHEIAPRGAYSAGMGYCMHRMGQFPDAEFYYQRALAQGHLDAACHHNLGCLYLDKNNLKEARRLFEQALTYDENSPVTHVFLSQVLARLETPNPIEDGALPENLQKAIEHLERGLPKPERTPATQALFAAHVHTMAFHYNAAHADRALAWLERAVDAGAVPGKIRSDRMYRPYRGNARFEALAERSAVAPPPPAWVAILDPIAQIASGR